MKIYITSLLLSLFLFSCQQGNKSSEENTEKSDSIESVSEISLSKTDIIEQLSEDEKETVAPTMLFKASGTEPGWFAEFYTDHLRFIFDYGKDSINLKKDFSNLKISDEKYISNEVSIENSIKRTIQIQVLKTECTSVSGDKKTHSVSIKLDHNVYNGCGEFIGN